MFDLKEHLAKIREGRDGLARELRDLETQRAALIDDVKLCEQQIEVIQEKLDEIDRLDLDKLIGPAPQRMTGVLQRVEETAAKLLNGLAWVTEQEIVKAVLDAEPGAKASSIRSALARLVDKGQLMREGKRGSRRYAKASTESGSPPAPTSKIDPAVRSQILREINLPAGKSHKELAWIVGDVATLNAILSEPEVESFQISVDGETRFRIRDGALGQRQLFDGADPPPAHANKA